MTDDFKERLARNLREQKPVLDRMAENDRCDGSAYCVNSTHIEGCLAQKRAIWLTREQRDWLAMNEIGCSSCAAIVDAWDRDVTP